MGTDDESEQRQNNLLSVRQTATVLYNTSTRADLVLLITWHGFYPVFESLPVQYLPLFFLNCSSSAWTGFDWFFLLLHICKERKVPANELD